ncbi:MAG: hypothetical protein KKF44_00035 [Nanoarchaeota archaeon]|nr:hypothetical protein [Nanoarchaeota archaeon]
MLTKERYEKEQEAYARLMDKAMPSFKFIENKRLIEVADFSLTNPGYKIGDTVPSSELDNIESGLGDFDNIGLGVYMIENSATRCAKFLAWKPGQLLPDHRHQTVYIVKSGSDRPTGLEDLIDLSEINTEFGRNQGELPEYPIDDFDYLVPDPKKQWSIEQGELAEKYATDSGGTVKKGKGETFTVLYGEGFYIGESLGGPHEELPIEGHEVMEYLKEPQMAHIYEGKNQVVIKMKVGESYELSTNTSHSVIAGINGMVALETSDSSWDPADIFSSKDVRRETRILMPEGPPYRIISQAQYFDQMGIQRQAG